MSAIQAPCPRCGAVIGSCDAPGCIEPAQYACVCPRCLREPGAADRYFACCLLHKNIVTKIHEQVRERPAAWSWAHKEQQ